MALTTQWNDPTPFVTGDAITHTRFNKVQENFLYLKSVSKTKIQGFGSGLGALTLGTTPQKEATGYFELSIDSVTGAVLIVSTFYTSIPSNQYLYVKWEIDGISDVGSPLYSPLTTNISTYYNASVSSAHTMSSMLPVIGLTQGTHTFEPVFYVSGSTGYLYPNHRDTNLSIMEL